MLTQDACLFYDNLGVYKFVALLLSSDRRLLREMTPINLSGILVE
jgi:hypothetical protein